MSWLKNLFGGGEKAERLAAESAPVSAIEGVELPMGIRLGGAVALDQTAFELGGAAFGFAPPKGHVVIEAYGRVDLGAGALLHRYYLSEDAFVQVNTTAGVVDEMKYFVFHETKHPATQRAFEAWVEQGSLLGATQAVVGGNVYRRVWGESADARWAPPVVFDEKIYRGRPPKFDYDLTHYCMLFQRELPGLGRVESLLISAEDYGPDEFCVTYSIGVDVTSADLDIT